MIACRGQVDIKELIGVHECAKTPPSLFKDEMKARHGNKATLITTLRDECKVVFCADLSDNAKPTAVVVDAMHMVQR